MPSFSFNRKHLALPYAVFQILFVVLPLLVIAYYAFTDKSGALSFANFLKFFTDSSSIATLLYSLVYGGLTTILCLAIGYPIAYILSNPKYNKSIVLVLLFVMPMWINFVLRTSATRELLFIIGMSGKHFINVMIGMVYNFLPFMILPLYSTMLKMDKSILEAASDLGATPMQVFIKAVIPLSKGGILSGITMVFMPTMTAYVITNALGENMEFVLGNLISEQFNQGNWNYGSAIAIILLVIIGISMLLNRKSDSEEVTRGGGLW